MMLLVPDQSASSMLELLVGKAIPEGLVLRLFTNDKQLSLSDTAEDYVEALGFGYEPHLFQPSSWDVNGDVATYPEVAFAFLGALGPVYGYFVTQSRSGRLWWAERFATAPYVIANVGDQIKVAPKFEMRS